MEAKVTMVTAVLDFAKRHQLSVFVQRRLSKGHYVMFVSLMVFRNFELFIPERC